MIAVTVGVIRRRCFRRIGEAALKVRPTLFRGVATPEAVVPSDVHDAESLCDRIGVTETVGGQQPVQERHCAGALCGDLVTDHPVDRASLFMLTDASVITGTRDVRGIRAVRGLKQGGKFLRAGLGRR